jgi:ATP-binding cassette, subfamily B (MDR/TAP), member 1
MADYAKAGAIAEEVLAGIRTVVAFGGETKEIARYEEHLRGARRSGIMRGMMTGASGGLIFGIMFAMYGLGFWYGVKLIMDDRESEECQKCPPFDFDCAANCVRYNAKALLTVFFSVLIGGFQLGQTAPYIEALTMAMSAAGAVYRIIDRVPTIDSSSPAGARDLPVRGNISFRKVFFAYPARPDVPVLDNFSLEVPAGKTVALVGASGCGKSTCIQLVQRFYDPPPACEDDDLKGSGGGAVLLDGRDLRELNIAWLRSQIGVVSQEPVLFDCSLRENILFGNRAATEVDIVAACQKANAWGFIQQLPAGLDTLVGERGAQLSGGQKQRIAIARAIVRNPPILLLDEATSALDNESEAVVQAALDAARSGRTTIVVAHRLTTIRTADLIVAVDQGHVQEMGSHEELMAKEGLYYRLVMRQLSGNRMDSDLKLTDSSPKYENVLEEKNVINRKLQFDEKRQPSLEEEFELKERKKPSPDHDTMAKSNLDASEDEQSVPRIKFMRLLRVNSPEWLYILLGVLCSAAMGGVMPIFSLLFGDVTGILAYQDTAQAREESVYYAILFGALGLGSTLAMFLQGLMFGISGRVITLLGIHYIDIWLARYPAG